MKIYRISQDRFKKSLVPPIPLHEKGGIEEGRRREEIICNAIKKLTQEWNVGPINYLHIDSRGDITMQQTMVNPSGMDYINSKEIDPDLVEIAREYNRGAFGGNISTRWITLNHFAWEKMLGTWDYYQDMRWAKKNF
jgi:hypothetical protein